MYITGKVASEAQLEKKTVKVLRDKGFLVYKFRSPANSGVPDDFLLSDGGGIVFMEFKSPTGKGRLSPLQEICIKKIRDKGHTVFIIASVAAAEMFIDEMLALRFQEV